MGPRRQARNLARIALGVNCRQASETPAEARMSDKGLRKYSRQPDCRHVIIRIAQLGQKSREHWLGLRYRAKSEARIVEYSNYPQPARYALLMATILTVLRALDLAATARINRVTIGSLLTISLPGEEILTMNQSQFVAYVSERLGISKAKALLLLKTLMDVAIEEVATKGKFVLPGIGTVVRTEGLPPQGD